MKKKMLFIKDKDIRFFEQYSSTSHRKESVKGAKKGVPTGNALGYILVDYRWTENDERPAVGCPSQPAISRIEACSFDRNYIKRYCREIDHEQVPAGWREALFRYHMIECFEDALYEHIEAYGILEGNDKPLAGTPTKKKKRAKKPIPSHPQKQVALKNEYVIEKEEITITRYRITAINVADAINQANNGQIEEEEKKKYRNLVNQNYFMEGVLNVKNPAHQDANRGSSKSKE